MSKLTERLGQLTRHFGSPSEGRSALNEAIQTLQQLERSNKELVSALNAFIEAESVSTAGNYCTSPKDAARARNDALRVAKLKATAVIGQVNNPGA